MRLSDLTALVDRVRATTRKLEKVALIAAFATLCLVWSLTLLVRGFRNASGLRGATLIAGLIGLVLLSEILSKVALAHLG